MTTSGVAIGMKISRLVGARPRNRCRASANATMVPRTVATSVASHADPQAERRATSQIPGAPHGSVHASVENFVQV